MSKSILGPIYIDVLADGGADSADRIEALGFNITRVFGAPVALMSKPDSDYAVLTRATDHWQKQINGRRVIVAERGD